LITFPFPDTYIDLVQLPRIGNEAICLSLRPPLADPRRILTKASSSVEKAGSATSQRQIYLSAALRGTLELPI
jgi:hypothetical protein